MKNRFRYLVILAVVLVIAGLVIMKEKPKTNLKEKPPLPSEEITALVDSSSTVSEEKGKAAHRNALTPAPQDTTETVDSVPLVLDKLPLVIDLGRGTCVPCKMMLPILQELQEEYKGRAIIKIVDIRYEPEQARFYKIRLIPTQIFFDTKGNEVYRHIGFMDKESIKRKFLEMGIQ
jgi:thioredoxin 1